MRGREPSGRAKELIVLPSGMNVWPQDVEDALRLQAGVKDASIIAVPTASGGATLHAYLLRAPGESVAGLRLVEALPRSPIGKVLKRELRTRLQPSSGVSHTCKNP